MSTVMQCTTSMNMMLLQYTFNVINYTFGVDMAMGQSTFSPPTVKKTQCFYVFEIRCCTLHGKGLRDGSKTSPDT